MITLSQVEYVAKLASLEINEEEKKMFCHQLGEILDFFRQLDEVDTKDIEPTFHVLPLCNVLREDEEGQSIPVEDALMNAPQRDENFFRIPKILSD